MVFFSFALFVHLMMGIVGVAIRENYRGDVQLHLLINYLEEVIYGKVDLGTARAVRAYLRTIYPEGWTTCQETGFEHYLLPLQYCTVLVYRALLFVCRRRRLNF